MYDVVIVGAGIAGCACAHFLARYDLNILVVDASYDIATGTTRANSGIVHGGYDPEPGTLKARFNIEGSRMYPGLARDLGFDFRQNGSLVVAFSEEERPNIEKLYARGITNGVEGLRIIESDELHEKEPLLNPAAVAALWVPTGGIVDPYGITLAFAETAACNGVTFKFDTCVSDIRRAENNWELIIDNPEGTSQTLEARIVINAAGLNSGLLNSYVSKENDFKITPRAGEYLLLDKIWGNAFTSTVFQVPTAAGKGVLVSPTVEGNLLIGPNAVAREHTYETQTTNEGLAQILKDASKTWVKIPAGDAITNFAGLRSTCVESPDFHLGEPADAPGFFNICGFDSPGLTAAPAVGKYFAEIISERLQAAEKPAYIDHRDAPRHLSTMSDSEIALAVAENPAWGRVVCRCEQVSEAEIVEALRSPVPARTVDAIKWRTRAGMGRCQAGFCLPLTIELIAKEHGIELTQVCKGSHDSRLILGERGFLNELPHISMGGAC